eukprot:4077945-Pyramimonas_sp.AAC.1
MKSKTAPHDVQNGSGNIKIATDGPRGHLSGQAKGFRRARSVPGGPEMSQEGHLDLLSVSVPVLDPSPVRLAFNT